MVTIARSADAAAPFGAPRRRSPGGPPVDDLLDRPCVGDPLADNATTAVFRRSPKRRTVIL